MRSLFNLSGSPYMYEISTSVHSSEPPALLLLTSTVQYSKPGDYVRLLVPCETCQIGYCDCDYVLTGNVAPHLYVYMHAKWMEFGLNLLVPRNFVQYVAEKFPYRMFWLLTSYLFCSTTLDSLSKVQTSFLPKLHTQLLMFTHPWTGLATCISAFEILCSVTDTAQRRQETAWQNQLVNYHSQHSRMCSSRLHQGA